MFQEPREFMPERQRVADCLAQRTGRQCRELRGLHLFLDDVEQWAGPLLAQSMSRHMIHTRVASPCINQKQCVGPLHQLPRDAVVRIEFECVEHLPARMRPASSMHHLWTTRVVICDIAIGLKNAGELAEELFRTFPPAPHPEVEDDTTSWPTVLPQICLMVFPAFVMHLHANRRLICLNVTSAD